MKGVSDETLMAYADGMLSMAEKSEVERFIANNPSAAEKIKKFKQSAVQVKSLGSALGKLEVSPSLRGRVEAMGLQSQQQTDNIISFPTRAANSNQKQPRMWQALAAAVALFAVGIWSGFQMAGQVNPQLIAVGATLPPDVSNVLATQPSGETQTTQGGKVRLISSFKLADGNICREFELTPRAGSIATLAIACKTTKSDFATRFAIATSSQATDYAPASANEAIDAYLTSIGAGSPLSAAEEIGMLQK
jgi:hypothetical protein